MSDAARTRVPTREGHLARRYGVAGMAVALVSLRLPWAGVGTALEIGGLILIGAGLYYVLVDPEPGGVVREEG